MKSRYLKQLLNDTEYIVHRDERNILISSPLATGIIKLNVAAQTLHYTMDQSVRLAPGQKPPIKGQELNYIWDKLQDLINDNQINDIFNNDDEIQNPITIWQYMNGQVLQKETDYFGWPNTTKDGYMIVDNMFFSTREEAINAGINLETNNIDAISHYIAEAEQKLIRMRQSLTNHRSYLESLNNLNQPAQQAQPEANQAI